MKYSLRLAVALLVLFSYEAKTFAQCTYPTISFSNPSFEGTPGAGITPSPWSVCQPGQTPDTQPGSWGITLPATNGSTYLGLVHEPSANWQEGASEQLPTALTSGVSYSFTVDLANSSSTGGGIDPGCAECQIWGGFGACDANTLLWASGNITPYDTWQTHTVSFTATQNFSWILIRINSLGCSSQPYILVDNLSAITPTVQPIVLTPLVNQPSCSGFSTGSAYMSYSGGIRPFTFQWSNGVTTQANGNLFAGTYGVTATDSHGCSATSSITINQTNSVSVTATPTNATCGSNNGSISAVASGGNGSFSYSWSNGGTTATITNLPTGTYSLTTTDGNGCSATTNATVSASSSITVLPTSTAATCGGSNGTATAVVTAGTGPFTYLWSNSQTAQTATGLTPGSYVVTVTSGGGCSAVSSVVVGSSAQLLLTPSNTNTACGTSNGSATVTVTSGTGPFTYAWSNGGTSASITNIPAGSYSVTVTGGGGCSASVDYLVTAASGLSITSFETDATCGGSNGSAAATVTSGAGPFTYLWSNNATSAIIANLSGGNYAVTVTGSSGCSATSSITVSGGIPVSLTPSATNSSCGTPNGSATVNALGTAPFNYLWSNAGTTATISNLSAGSYSVTVTDASGCSATSSVTVSFSNLVSLSASFHNAHCNFADGHATVNALTGTSPFTYLWSDGSTSSSIDSLSSGTYSVTVTSQDGCTAAATISITSSSPVTTSAVTVNTTCGSANGSIIVNVNSGTSPYTYTWSNGGTSATASNLPAGVYSITVSDVNGCSASLTDTVGTSSITPAVISTNNNTICSGDSTQVCVQGTYSAYHWNTGATTQCIYAKLAGNYYLTVTEGNCTVSSNHLPITVLPLPPVSISVNGDTLTGYNAVTYQWYLNNSPIQGATSQIYIAHQAGNYNLQVTDSNGCAATSSKVTVTVSGIDEVIDASNVNVYPNPTQGATWNVEVGENLLNCQVDIFDAEGRLVYRQKLEQLKSEIDLNVARGVYMMRISSAKSSYSLKLVKL